MEWEFLMPVRVVFGAGASATLPELLSGFGVRRAAIVCDPFLARSGVIEPFLHKNPELFAGVFSEIRANPTFENVNACAEFLRSAGAEGVVAVGGGSVLDCAKAAAALAATEDRIEAYASGAKMFAKVGLPLIALPTTAGTGSEVTCISVLSNETTHEKAPVASPLLFARAAVVDPELTKTAPPAVTAASGMDALSHALEALWCIHHRSASDALALEAVSLILKSIEAAYHNPEDIAARSDMSEGALLAGIAFSQTKTAGVHACSYPLTAVYGLSHGAACAFTLAAFTRLNASAENGRMHQHSQTLGFADAFALADEIDRLNNALGLPITLASAGIPEGDLPSLAAGCLHPNMKNNPVEMDEARILELLKTLA